MTTRTSELERVLPGMPVLYAGNRLTYVPDAIAERFRLGDRLLVVQETGDILHVPASQYALVHVAVERAQRAFVELRELPDAAVEQFFRAFARRLEDDGVWEAVAAANAADVGRACARGRSTTRLVADEKMRRGMVEGLQQWLPVSSPREHIVQTVEHAGWRIECVRSPVGVVGFVFEGRPNVLADACGVLRGGNTAVLAIGSDALATARAIASSALEPALAAAGLPQGAVILLESADHAAKWALFGHPGLALAVARGSGPAVLQLGAIARQVGTPVSEHGTGGGWIVADERADPATFGAAVYHSLDRKVCNTLNTVCIVDHAAQRLMPLLLDALERRGRALGHGYKLHVADGSECHVPSSLFRSTTTVLRATGPVEEPVADIVARDQLGHEWEWERTPEITFAAARDLGEAIQLFNAQSPRFVASLVSEDPARHEHFFKTIEAPFVGNGFTRWVDGQRALRLPEFGLSNWQNGRLLGRSGILTGEGVYTLRLRAMQTDPNVHA